MGKIWDVTMPKKHLQMTSKCGKPNNKLFSGLHKPSWVHTTWTDLKRYELYDQALHSLRPWKQVLQRRLFPFEVDRLSHATRTEDDDMGRGSKLKSISVLTCMKIIQLYFFDVHINMMIWLVWVLKEVNNVTMTTRRKQPETTNGYNRENKLT